MSILDTLVAKMGYIKAAGYKYPQFLLAMAEEARWDIPDGSLYKNQAELYQRLSWVHTAVAYTSAYAATTPISIMQKRGERTKDVDNHPFETLMTSPNPNQSRYEFLRATLAYILLTGNAYWWLNKTSESAAPMELWCLPTSQIRPVPDGRMYIKGYMYDPGNGQEIPIPEWQIVHFKDYHPNDAFMGLSKVEPIATVAATDLNQQKWMGKIYGKNNGRLPGILAFADSINDSDWQRMQESVREAAMSNNIMMIRHAGKGGVEWMQAVAKIAEMEYNEQRAFTKEEVYSVFAPGLASVIAINATEANARTGKATLIEFCIWPMLVSVAEKITSKILPLYEGKQIKLTAQFDDIRITDRAMELQEQQAFAMTHTIDEIRARYYEDDPLAQVTKVESDNRGIMLPAQVSPTTPVPSDEEEEPEPQPIPVAGTVFEPQQEEQPEEEEGEDETDENAAADAEMKAWRKFAIRRIGKPARAFECKHIPEDTQRRIRFGLAGAKTEAEIEALFDKPEAIEMPPEPLLVLAAELKRANDILERTGAAESD